MSVVIALDAGTTGIRALAISESGKIVGLSHQEFTQYYPQPGWVEHDPQEIWQAACSTLHDLYSRLDEPIAAIGIANQRETAVAWDKQSGECDHRAIVWQDRRTADICRRITLAGYQPRIRELTGLVLDPYFSATKFLWLKKRTEIRQENLAFGTIDTWLLWNLTQGRTFATEPSNASRTMLYDIHKLQWSEELCDFFDISMFSLPEVKPSSGIFGYTRGTPLPDNIPIAGMIGDQQAALFGQACFDEGDTKNTYGTGSFVLMNLGPELVRQQNWVHLKQRDKSLDRQGLLTSVGWELPSGEVAYVLEGSIFATGAIVQWLRDGLGIISEASDLEDYALKCDDSNGCMLVPAFTGLGSPWWEPNARGAIFGISMETGIPQLARATISAMSWQTYDVVRKMQQTSGRQLTSLRVDGGASVMDTLLQHQADVLDAAVERPKVTESTARGAAWLAGLGVGLWGSLDELAEQWELDQQFEPTGRNYEHEQRRWNQAVDRTIAFASQRESGELGFTEGGFNLSGFKQGGSAEDGSGESGFAEGGFAEHGLR